MSAASKTPSKPDVAKDLIRLRSLSGASTRWENLTGLSALLSLPDVVAQEPDPGQIARRAKLAQSRIRADVSRIGDIETARILRMMLAIGRASWADDNVSVGVRRKLYVTDQRSEVTNLDTLRTRRERLAAEQLALLLLERNSSAIEAPTDDLSWIVDSGVEFVTLDFYHAVDWESLLLGAENIDLFFTYARTWRRHLGAVLPELRHHSDPRIRVVLPSILSPRTTALDEIAKRAGQSKADLCRYVAGSYAFYDRLGAQIFTLDAAQLYASYRFDDLVVASLYNHQRSQTEGVPTIVSRRGGSLFAFFHAEFECLVDSRLKYTQRLPSNWKALCKTNGIAIIET